MDAAILNVVVNGVAEVGLAAGADSRLVVEERLVLVPVAQLATTPLAHQLAHALHFLGNLGDLGDKTRQMVENAVLCILHGHWHGLHSGSTDQDVESSECRTEALNEAVINTPEMAERVRTTLVRHGAPDVRQNAALLVLATKVNWWQMNHHVGQGGIQGFASKALKRLLNLSDKDKATTAVISMMHRLGHFVDTRLVMSRWMVSAFPEAAAAGLVDIQAPVAAPGWFQVPAPSTDIVLRLKAMPAGTGKCGYCLTVLQRAACSAYSLFFVPTDTDHAFLASCTRIAARPWRYHTGALYLTGQPRSDYVEPNETMMAQCVAFVEVTAANSTLARAPSAMNAAEARLLAANQSAGMRRLRTALTSSVVSDDQLDELVRQAGVARDANGIAMFAQQGQAFRLADALAPPARAAAAGNAGAIATVNTNATNAAAQAAGVAAPGAAVAGAVALVPPGIFGPAGAADLVVAPGDGANPAPDAAGEPGQE